MPEKEQVPEEEPDGRSRKLRQLAEKVLNLAETELMLKLPYLDRALWQLKQVPSGEQSLASDGESLFYEPAFLLRRTCEDPAFAVRAWLHVLMHCLFGHMWTGPELDADSWDLACDIFAEGMIASLQIDSLSSPQQNYRSRQAWALRQKICPFTAEKIYQTLQEEPEDAQERQKRKELFSLDDHRIWYAFPKTGEGKPGRKKQQSGKITGSAQTSEGSPAAPENRDPEQTRSRWQTLAGELEQEFLSGSGRQGVKTADLEEALGALRRKRIDYGEFLRRFAARSEVLKTSQEEFDYIFYSYGLALYKDMPLIEPLEYREDRKIRDFVIVIDTSGSVSGRRVRQFLEKTWEVLRSEKSFERTFHIRILQCDTEIKRDDLVTNRQELDRLFSSLVIRGRGGTDFRPAFRYVEQLQKNGDLKQLKGLLYFTDGLGQFPGKAPVYPTAFVFTDQSSHSLAALPSWAIAAVMEGDRLAVYG